jgi:UDP-N-acetylglucosamine 4,6-dehydratase
MQGGEIFVPKIPSMKITDLAEAIAPGLTLKTIGIRPGEKLHEVMCPADDYHLTREFDEYFVITPTIEFSSSVDFNRNAMGEVGKPVPEGFEYSSGTNTKWLSGKELLNMII